MEPSDDAICRACDHRWFEHVDEEWKGLSVECECCASGQFIGDPIAVDDMDDEQLEAWKRWRKPR